jgi:hypothetical protein
MTSNRLTIHTKDADYMMWSEMVSNTPDNLLFDFYNTGVDMGYSEAEVEKSCIKFTNDVHSIQN